MSTVAKSKGKVVMDTHRQKVSITLPAALLAKIDAEAEANYVSRSAVIVAALRVRFG